MENQSDLDLGDSGATLTLEVLCRVPLAAPEQFLSCLSIHCCCIQGLQRGSGTDGLC